jgi:oxygen-independent coproporphyrinogen-3 oxidase
MSSISSTATTYRQNTKTLPEWRAALAEGRLPVDRFLELTEEDRRRRTLIMRLMCDRSLNFSALSRSLGVDVQQAYAAELASLADLEFDGIVERTSQGVAVTPIGVPLLRVVAMRFDPHILSSGTQHSRTI